MRWNPLGAERGGGLPSLEFRAHFFLIMCFGPRCICAHVQIVACDYGIMRAHRQLMLLTREARGKTVTRLSTAVASTRTCRGEVFGPRWNPASAAGRFQGPGTDTTMQWDLILFWNRIGLHWVFVWARDWTRAEEKEEN